MAAAYSGPTTSGGLAPDPVVITAWLHYWFQFCSQGHIEIAWSDPATGAVDRARHFALTDKHAAAQFAAQVNTHPGCNVYFGCSTVYATLPDKPRRAKDEHVIQTPGLWIDGDTQEHIQKLHNVEHLLQPSALVITSDIPARRQHVYIRLQEPLPVEQVKQANQRLVLLYGGSVESVNPARILRLPGCLAWPYKPGRSLELTRLEQRGPDSYPWSRVNFALPPIPPEQVANNSSSSVRETADELIASIRPGNWHTPVLRLVASMLQARMPDRMIHLIDPAVTLPGYTLEQTYDDVQKLIDSGRAKFGVLSDAYGPPPDRFAETQEAFAAYPLPPGLDTPGPGLPGLQGGLSTVSMSAALQALGQPPEWLIQGWLPKAATAMLTGLPGTGKSPLVQFWSVLLALGRPWLGSVPSKRTRVVYWAAESVGQTVRNCANYAADLLDCDLDAAAGALDGWLPILLQPGLLLEAHWADIGALLDREGASELGPIGVLVIDTLRAISTGGVTKDEDMQAVQQAVAALRAGRPDLTIVIIHHSPKGDPEGASGSNRLEGMADVLLNIVALGPARNKSPGGDDPGKAPGTSELSVVNKLVWSAADADGWKHARARLTVPRMKMWQTPDPLSLRYSNLGPDFRLEAGAEAEGGQAFADYPLPPGDPSAEHEGFAAPRGIPHPAASPKDLDSAVCALLSETAGFVGFADLLNTVDGMGLIVDRRAKNQSRSLQASLDRLVERGLVEKSGQFRSTRYGFRV